MNGAWTAREEPATEEVDVAAVGDGKVSERAAAVAEAEASGADVCHPHVAEEPGEARRLL